MLKLCDFGVSRVPHMTRAYYGPPKQYVGTAIYMAPEVWSLVSNPRVAIELTSKTDMFSLGCILFEACMLTSAFKPEGLADGERKRLENDIRTGNHRPFDDYYS